MTLRSFLTDTGERAASTFIQTLVVVLFAAGVSVIGNPDWGVAAIAGLIAAAVSVLTSMASVPLPTLSPWPELGLRVVKTFVQSFVGALVVANYINVNWAGALATALPVALLAAAKGLIAMSVPGTVPGPSLLAVPAPAPVAAPAPAPAPVAAPAASADAQGAATK